MCLALIILIYFLFILFIASFVYPLPINDSGVTRYRTIPWATLILILVNTVVFVTWIGPNMYERQQNSNQIQYVASEEYKAKMNIYGFKESTIRDGTGVAALVTFTSMFMHASFWHLFGNMVYLWTFGRRVEDACGSGRFMLFYLICGLISNVGSVLLTPSVDVVPSVGASGAIAGVMGAYLFLFPGVTINCLWGIGSLLRLPVATVRLLSNKPHKFWRWTVSLPAWLLLVWFVFQNLVPSLKVISSDEQVQGVNTLAHLAGFFGALTVFFFVRKDLLMRYLHGRSL